ncbi:glycoside hydrolase family 16 protein [Plebeiibacterium marinum]|uniref:Glycoside hydrolase family 16 protein n=1 Tax=Plebeiibacterium marinum TaxID=2992111 RepID=A0AAE3SJB5_9BACT|nr:glycoside hydrolase family 16 protein [Plebeiobacterium marinum]MCW3804175.1 glycoside hydrolase family 16 protein [Plebeiobacterium marinum]
MRLLYLIIIFTSCFAVIKSQNKEEIYFSGFEWINKISPDPTGPGNNIFGTHPKNVTLDNNGNVTLRIRRNSSCAEIFSKPIFKEGRYETTIVTNTKTFHPYMVFGIFLYDHSAAPHYNEIDIEYSLWGRNENKNMQYAVHTNSGTKVHRFSFKKKKTVIKHIIDITNDSIHFKSTVYEKAHNRLLTLSEISYPRPEEFAFNKTRFHFNLWLMNKDIKVVSHFPKVKILDFNYHPSTK